MVITTINYVNYVVNFTGDAVRCPTLRDGAVGGVGGGGGEPAPVARSAPVQGSAHGKTVQVEHIGLTLG